MCTTISKMKNKRLINEIRFMRLICLLRNNLTQVIALSLLETVFSV